MEVRQDRVRTELGVFPADWPVLPLNRISPKQGVGLVINPSTYFDKSGTVPLLVGSHVSEGGIDASTANRISEASNAALSASRLTAGDLVTVRVGEPGVTAVVPPHLDGCNCASMMIVRKHPSFNSYWLCAVMNSRLGRSQVEHVQYGTAQKQFNISDAIHFRFATPSRREQDAIAEALSDSDALLAGLDRVIAKKRDLKQAAMRQLLTGRTRLPGFDCEWQRLPLSSVVADLEAGVSVNSVTGGGHHSLGEPGILKTSCVANGVFNPEEFKLIDQREISRARLSPRQNTLIISRMNTPNLVGEVGFVEQDYPSLFLPDRLWLTRFRPDSGLWPKWLAYQMSSPITQVAIKDLASGTSGSMKNISKIKLLALPLDFPPPAEQAAIAAFLSDFDAELTALEARRDKTRALKQGVMQELLTGRTRLI